jgi:long-subunit fatty acid transport protein
MLKRLAIVNLVLAGLCQQAYALEFQPVGNGALGVGGAGIARTEGAMSAYWNPAGLAFAQKTVSVSLSVGAGLSPDKNLAQDLDNLSIKFDAWNSNQTDATAQTNLANAVALVPDSDTYTG